MCVTILAVLDAEDIFPSEQACFGVSSRVGVVCYVPIPGPAVLGIILFCVIVLGSAREWPPNLCAWHNPFFIGIARECPSDL